MKKDNTTKWAMVAALVGLTVYYFSTQNTPKPFIPPAGSTQQLLPNGQPAWVTTTGAVLDAAGTIMGSLQAVLAAINAGKNPYQSTSAVNGCGCNTRRTGYNYATTMTL